MIKFTHIHIRDNYCFFDNVRDNYCSPPITKRATHAHTYLHISLSKELLLGFEKLVKGKVFIKFKPKLLLYFFEKWDFSGPLPWFEIKGTDLHSECFIFEHFCFLTFFFYLLANIFGFLLDAWTCLYCIGLKSQPHKRLQMMKGEQKRTKAKLSKLSGGKQFNATT